MSKAIHGAARARAVVSKFPLLLAAALVLSACGKDETAPADAAAAGATTAAPTAQNAVSAQVASMSPEQLREAASKAYNENRLYAPAGDSAVEYYLALRDKQPGDAAVASALTDLLPMTVIAIEQSITREDFAEAQRLSALLEKADAQHPALARLKTSITTQQQLATKRAEEQKLSAEDEAKRLAELEKQRLEDQKRQQEAAAKQLAAQQSTQTQQAAADRRAAEQRAAEQQAAERAAAAQRATEQREAEQRAAQARTAAAQPAAATELRALSTPAPRFPPEAMRAGQSGEVQVEFTVAPDGSVGNVRVVRSTPARVFDREAVAAVKRWRFQPVDAPVTTRRTIGFNPGS